MANLNAERRGRHGLVLEAVRLRRTAQRPQLPVPHAQRPGYAETWNANGVREVRVD